MISSYSSPRVFSCLSFFSWHSHTVMTFHPMSSSSFFVRLSLSLLPYNLFCQYSTLDLGILAYLHPSWRCQKQPWTSTIVLYFGSTMSGCPGYLLSFFPMLSGTFLPFIGQIRRHSGALVSIVYVQSKAVCGHVCGRCRGANVGAYKQRISDKQPENIKGLYLYAKCKISINLLLS